MIFDFRSQNTIEMVKNFIPSIYGFEFEEIQISFGVVCWIAWYQNKQ